MMILLLILAVIVSSLVLAGLFHMSDEGMLTVSFAKKVLGIKEAAGG